MTTVITGTPQFPPGPPPSGRAPGGSAEYDGGPVGAHDPRPAPRWRIEPVRPEDGPALAALFDRCSAETVRLRFFGLPRELPRPYLDAVLAGRPASHDAVVAYPRPPGGPDAPAFEGGRPAPVGLGSFAADRGDEAADPHRTPGTDLDYGRHPCPVGELGLLVVDGWQRQGAGAAMLDVLLDRARTRGARLVSASVLPGRQALLGALARRLRPVRTSWEADALTGVYRLDPERRTEAAHHGSDGRTGNGRRPGN
ncbi:hypothetical protein RVR_4628 [Actinacidiphila reveromycinica]|uniref:N-acetyltransferase domain-containing protein n=1 Tax=Actinacidiphila reveromycinica TaxID=659352 RepID=A0A7U3UTG4_9ACTN|nr:GNAT family N-acetyltransferase [Streptomyces sp. SN-593]BBA98444.1 hypothetical protein RVR_4628 [Streptomyces sp. SN-593]